MPAYSPRTYIVAHAHAVTTGGISRLHDHRSRSNRHRSNTTSANRSRSYRHRGSLDVVGAGAAVPEDTCLIAAPRDDIVAHMDTTQSGVAAMDRTDTLRTDIEAHTAGALRGTRRCQ